MLHRDANLKQIQKIADFPSFQLLKTYIQFCCLKEKKYVSQNWPE